MSAVVVLGLFFTGYYFAKTALDEWACRRIAGAGIDWDYFICAVIISFCAWIKCFDEATEVFRGL